MLKEDIFIVLAAIILISGMSYFYQNIDSFNCFVENSTQSVLSDIKYEFEPNGTMYGKVKVYRFNIVSSGSDLEYYGMRVTNANGDVLFFDSQSNPEGGLLSALLTVNETDVIKVDRFFKRKCYSEIAL